jgi:hypothetical protein
MDHSSFHLGHRTAALHEGYYDVLAGRELESRVPVQTDSYVPASARFFLADHGASEHRLRPPHMVGYAIAV